MKGMLKILLRYIFSAAGIALVLLALNASVLIAWMVKAGSDPASFSRISDVADHLTHSNGEYRLSSAGEEALHQSHSWAMLLDANGKRIWSENLPEDVPSQYSVADVASFTHWYLQDYPVHVWRYEDGLLVLGSPKNSIWKTDLEMPESLIRTTIAWIPMVILINTLAAVLLALLLGLRQFLSLRALAHGIVHLAENKSVNLPTGGPLADLALKLNQTSERLQEQNLTLHQRENARNTWIAGVSHDIRTPLSMIMGYASQLEDNPHLSTAEQEQARIIRQQSEKIKALVNDLNLATRLEYDMQPIQIEEIHPAALLRNLVADFLNNNLDPRYEIELHIHPAAGDSRILADEKLLWRALSNLVNNSIQHNLAGCIVQVRVESNGAECWITISDNGAGFSQQTLNELHNPPSVTTTGTRGLGLTIVQQIIHAHKGRVEFTNLPPHGCSVTICLPLVDPD